MFYAGQQCRNILAALDSPIPQGARAGVVQLRTTVRQAIGLPAI
jgi:hypothetical protein